MDDISRIIHDMIFRDKSQSLCSRAWGNKLEGHIGARIAVALLDAVFYRIDGPGHCRKSWARYNDPASRKALP